jgi:hypothetical protein
MRVLRNLDLLVLAVALPVVVAGGFPLLGWAFATGAWLAARGVQSLTERRALAKGDRKAALGARAAALVGRLYIVGLSVAAAGFIDRDAGVVAGVVSVAAFTVYFASLLVTNFLEENAR